MPITRTARAVACAAALLLSAHASAADLPALGLSRIHATDDAVCRTAAETLRADKACRNGDAINCSDSDMQSVHVGAATFTVIQDIAANAYGYTRVARSLSARMSTATVIYLEKFHGDHSDRLLETWKVNHAALNQVLALPPGPLLATSSLHAEAFAALLANGEKIADEWSPVLQLGNELYAVTRECSGQWVFGGYFACNRVNQLTVLRLHGEARAHPVCQFARKH